MYFMHHTEAEKRNLTKVVSSLMAGSRLQVERLFLLIHTAVGIYLLFKKLW